MANVTIDNRKGEVLIDFTGSSPESNKGVNAVLNYTHAYATCAVRSILNVEIPNNAGSLAPIKVTAPAGSIVNCRYPAPVAARHIVGMYILMPMMKAFYQITPTRSWPRGLAHPFGSRSTAFFRVASASSAPFQVSPGAWERAPTSRGSMPRIIRQGSVPYRSK